MTDPEKKADVSATQVNGSAAANIDVPQPPPADPNADKNTPESFSVTQAQFDKFYDKTTKSYNWENHAKELAWQMNQGKDSGAKKDGKAAAPATQVEAQAAVAKAGLDMASLEAELAENGALSQESLDKLAAAGIPKETAEGYSKFLVAKAEEFVNEVKGYLGGDQGMATLKAWALKNLSPAEIKQYETKLSDPAEWKVYADSLKTRAGVRSGQPASLVHGSNAQGSGSNAQGYKDMAELTADQRNPKYKTDPKFRAEVMARARASTFDVNPRAHVGR